MSLLSVLEEHRSHYAIVKVHKPFEYLLRRISLGGIALILAGLMLIPHGILTANVPSAPEQNLEFAAGANSFGYRLSMMLVGISLALFILGVFALYAHLSQTKQEKMAFAGLIVTVGLLARVPANDRFCRLCGPGDWRSY